MIITCASCQKRYLLEKEELGPEGRLVRCVACGHTWHQKPMEETVNYVDFSAETIVQKRASSSSLTNRVVGWGFYVLSLFMLLGGLYFTRTTIVSFWPATAGAYRLAGIPIHSPYEILKIEKLTSLVEGKEGQETIAVRGQVVNESQEVIPLSSLRLSAYGPCSKASLWSKVKRSLGRENSIPKNLCVLDSWRVTLGETRIFPGEKVHFETKPRLVPDATNILVEF